MSRYPLGQPVTIPITVKQRNADGSYSLVDAATVTTLVKVHNTDGSFTTTGTYTSPAHDSLGTYHQDIPAADLTLIDTYQWTVTTTGSGAGVTFGEFDVFDPFAEPLNTGYCTTEELKARLNITASTDDLQLEAAVGAASRAIDGYCERYFYKAAATRTYVPDDLYRTRVDDLVSVATLATDPAGTTAQGGTFPVTWATSDFQLLPYNPGKLGEQWPYTQIRAVGHFTFPWVIPLLLMRMDRVQVTGTFGWPAVPEAVHLAALIAAGELFRMRDMPVGGEVPGEFTIASLGPAIGSRLGQLLGPYCRNPVLAA